MSILHDFIINADFTDGHALARNIKGFSIANGLKNWELVPPVAIQSDLQETIAKTSMPILIKRNSEDKVSSVLCYLWNPDTGCYTAFEVLASNEQDYESLYSFSRLTPTPEDLFIRNIAKKSFIARVYGRYDLKKVLDHAFSELLKHEGVEKSDKFDFMNYGAFLDYGVRRIIRYKGNIYAFTKDDSPLGPRRVTVYYTKGAPDVHQLFDIIYTAMYRYQNPEYQESLKAQNETSSDESVSGESSETLVYVGQIPKIPSSEKTSSVSMDVMENMGFLAKMTASFRGTLDKIKSDK